MQPSVCPARRFYWYRHRAHAERLERRCMAAAALQQQSPAVVQQLLEKVRPPF